MRISEGSSYVRLDQKPQILLREKVERFSITWIIYPCLATAIVGQLEPFGQVSTLPRNFREMPFSLLTEAE